mmetsp:Transcript_36538/g.91612  ORF Transcript_36538/g.91612 Transcript_36538/m.91612 type:complete len:658 (+) Transcript_36538:464-2437(+)
MSEDKSDAFASSAETLKRLPTSVQVTLVSKLLGVPAEGVAVDTLADQLEQLCLQDDGWRRLCEEELDVHEPPAGGSWQEAYVASLAGKPIPQGNAVHTDDDDDAQGKEGQGEGEGEAGGSDADGASEEELAEVDPARRRLIDVVDGDTFLSELRAATDQLMSYLKQHETMQELIKLLTEDHPSTPQRLKLKLPQLAFQAIGNEALLEVMISNTDLLDLFFQFLDITRPCKPRSVSISGFFSRIADALFERYPTEFIFYMKSRENMVSMFLDNIDDQYVMDILLKLVDCGITHDWLHQAQLIPKLISILTADRDVEDQENIATVLVSIFSICQPYAQVKLITDLFSDETIAVQLLDYMSASVPDTKGFRIKQGLNVVISILNLLTDETLEELPSPVFIQTILSRLSFFTETLRLPVEEIRVRTSNADWNPPLGSSRLKILELISALLFTGLPVVLEELVRLDIFPTIVDLFFHYRWNNMMHHQVEQIITTVLCGTDDSLILSVLEKTAILNRVVDVFEQHDQAGYTGFLIRLANELVKITKYSAGISMYLCANERWMQFVEGELQERNCLEGTPLGGEMPIMSGEEEYYEGECSGYYYGDEDNQVVFEDEDVELYDDEEGIMDDDFEYEGGVGPEGYESGGEAGEDEEEPQGCQGGEE